MTDLYTTAVTSTGDGRRGRITSSDGNLDLALVSPRELGGSGDAGTNPEQLFAGGYAACFHSALRAAARDRDLQLDDSQITVTVSLVKMEDGRFTLAVSLEVRAPGIERSLAEELTAEADRLCPYSNACRADVQVEVGVTD